MYKTWQKWLTLAMAGAMAFSFTACGGDKKDSGADKNDDPIYLTELVKAKNVILLIGDGMGPEQIKAGELYRNKKLAMQNFPYYTMVETRSANEEITDSAAAATALATGVRTNNGMVGKDATGADLETIVDIAHGLGKRTGVIATEELFGATPMGFSGHADNRDLKNVLLPSAAASSNVNLFASNLMNSSYHKYFTEEGYQKVDSADAISDATAEKVFGCYSIMANYESMYANGGLVSFDRLVTEALEYLAQDEDGFFLMAEGSKIDKGGHNNNFKQMLGELLAFDDGVQAALKWAKDRDDTVVIVTADHETGGLSLNDGVTHEQVKTAYSGKLGSECFTWSTTSHTSTDVFCFINGANINFEEYSFESKARIKNTDIFEIMKYLLVGESSAE